MFETLLADVRYAFRWLRKSPAFTLLAISSFAIGIGFNTALFTLVDSLLFRPLPVDRPDRLVDIYTSSSDGDIYSTSGYPDFVDWKKQNTVFSDMMAYSPSLAAVSMTDRSRLALGEVVTGSYFNVLGLHAALGRTLLPEDDVVGAPRAVVLSHRVWMRDFAGSANAIGQSLHIHGQSYNIVGVMPASFTGMMPMLSPELWTAAAYIDEVEPGGIQDSVPSPSGTTPLDQRGRRWLFAKARLKPEATVEQAVANMSVISQNLATEYPQTNRARKISLKRTSEVHIHPDADKMLLPIASGLMVVVGMVLLIACANVASMLLARASGRQKEIGIRLAIGANRRRIVRQLVTESLVIAGLGSLAGLSLAWLLLRAAMTTTLPIPIPLTFALSMDVRVLAFTVGLTMMAGMIAGLAPALKATQLDLVGELKGDAAVVPASRRRFTLRDSLVASQMAVTTVLLVVAALLSRSLLSAQKTGLGFKSEGIAVLSAELDMLGYTKERGKAFWDEAIPRLRALPGVEAVALTERSPMSINYNRNAIFFPERPQLPEGRGNVVDVTRVTPSYFETLHVPLLRGRVFTTSDTPESPGVVIVNEAMARKYWPDQDAIGKRFRTRTVDGPEFEVVGVTANYRVNTMGEEVTPYIHFAATQRPANGYEVLARGSGDASALLASVRKELLSMEPNLVFLQNQTLQHQVGATLFPAKAGAWAVSSVGIVAMLLAAIGLYGVIGYSVSRRTKEIGVRMALGAQPGEVSRLIMRQGMRVAGAGLIVGAIFAVGAGFAVSGVLYGISPVDPIAWLGAVGLLSGVAALANLVPAQRAAKVKPWLALRTD
ncbi:MAG: ABC transporter permease [Vicinamibacteria bacterium]